MNVFILTDLEGIKGVNDIGYMDRNTEEYKQACRNLTDTINRAIATCYECGADQVFYMDGHGGGRNVDFSDIDKRAVHYNVREWVDLLKTGAVDCQIELGCHARPGTLNGFLDHTLSSASIFRVMVNGKEMSELGLHAILCGKYNVPLIACVGDEAACSQSKEYVPEIHAGAVKIAYGRNRSETYENADEILEETIRRALADYKNISCFHVQEPAEVEVTFYRTDMCDRSFERCSDCAERVDARTLRTTVSCIRDYEDLKFWEGRPVTPVK